MTAKEFLYQKCRENDGCFLSGQVGWITYTIQEHSIAFAKWINAEGWREYDEGDRWICPSNNYQVYTTRQLYEMFEESMVTF